MNELQGAIPTPQEAPSPNPQVEALAKMPALERTAKYLGASQGFLKEKITQGSLTDEQKPKAEQALQYNGGAVTKESSGYLKSTFDILDELGKQGDTEASDIRKEIVVHARVQVGEGDSRKIYTPEEWDQELQNAKTPEERAQLEAQALYGFVDPDAPTKQPEKPQELPEDKAIATQIAKFNIQIKEARAKGLDTAVIEQHVAMLRLVQRIAQGEGGVLLKAHALSQLQNAGVTGLNEVLEEISPQVSAAEQGVIDLLLSSGIPQDKVEALRTEIQKKGLGAVMQKEVVEKAEGLDIFIFGKELSEGEAKSFLAAYKQEGLLERYGTKSAIVALLLMLVSFGGPAILASNELAKEQRAA